MAEMPMEPTSVALPVAAWPAEPAPAAPAGPPATPPDAPPPPTPAPPAPDRPATLAADDKDTAHLSDIIVTTNQAEVDLTDPDVRALLEELVDDELRLAETYRSQGQVLDAILQLTEAEKACQALGDTERSDKVRAMMKELQP